MTQNGTPTAVLQDVACYERQRRALQLRKVLTQGDRDHDVGHVHDTAAVNTAIRDRLAAHRDQASTHTSTSPETTPRAPTPVLGKRSPPPRVVFVLSDAAPPKYRDGARTLLQHP